MPIGPRFDEVLDAARVGRGWAFEVLYRDLAPAVIGYLRGQGAREPEDLASEVFVGLVRNLPTFRGDERSFRAWVFSIAHRRLVDERRRLLRAREEFVSPHEIVYLRTAGVVGGIEDDVIGALDSGVIGALGSLTPEQRSVVLLRVLADLSVAEVARVLGKSQGAVKTLQRRALRALARRIEREGVS